MNKIQIPILRGVVCGMEHAGTTLLAQLLRQHPHLETGYEVGVLWHDSIADFWSHQGHWKQANDPEHRYGLETAWKLDAVGREAIRAASDWQDFYATLHAHSPMVRDKSAFLIDKTPFYQEKIDVIAGRFDVPIVIIIKDPVLLYDSWYRRMKTPVGAFSNYYRQRAETTIRAREAFPEQILLIRYEDLIRDTDVMMETVFNHIGVEPMILPDVLDVDFPGKVPDTIIDDIAMRLKRVGQQRADRLRQLIPDLCYLVNQWI